MTEPTSPAAHTFYVWQNLAIHMGSGIPADLHRDFPVQICLALDWSLALRGGTREHWRLFTAALISVPFQLNFDQDIGPQDEGERWLLNVQPVVPFDLHDDWNVISRTILPLVSQSDIFPGAASQSGIVDVVQSVFFSPKAPTANGWISGAGPVLLLPTGSDELLTADQWAAGPTRVALKQQGPYAYGVLVSHLWSFAGDDDRTNVNGTFPQPFMTHMTPTGWSFTAQTETTYDWDREQRPVPVNLVAANVTTIGNQLVSVGGGRR